MNATEGQWQIYVGYPEGQQHPTNKALARFFTNPARTNRCFGPQYDDAVGTGEFTLNYVFE